MAQFPVSALTSVDLGVPNVAQAEAFYTTIWGLRVAARTADTVYLRATGDDFYVVSLSPAEKPLLRAVSFRAESVDALQHIAGVAPIFGGSILEAVAANKTPEGGTALTIRSPEGWILRFIAGGLTHTDGAPVPDMPWRLAHVNLNTPKYEAAMDFLRDVAGFKKTDRTALMGFVRCNPDHHAVVIANSPCVGLNHIAFLVPDWESVMRGAGRMIDAGFPIAWGVGRHGPGNNVFAYFLDPYEFVIEYTAEVLQVDDTYAVGGPEDWTWLPGRTDHWGILPPKADRVKAAQLAIPFEDR